MFRSVAVALIAAALPAAAIAGTTHLDISSAVNANLYTFTGGTQYPPSGSTVTINGASGPATFTLANYYPASFMAPDVGVVVAGNGSPATVVIDTPDYAITGPTTFYSLINSAFGVNGQTIGDLTLNFASGAHFVYALTEGDNVRDHYNGIFNNVATGVYGTATYNDGSGRFNDDRFDAQQIVLPSTFLGDTLTSVTLDSTNGGGGYPFLTALSAVGGVPEPATWGLMIAGFGLVGLAARRRQFAVAV